MSTRAYVPATLDDLARFVAEGGIGPSPVHAHAVTDWLRRQWPDAEEEDREYAALTAAADDAASRLVGDSRPRRVVLAVDVEDLTEDRDSTRVVLDTAVPMRQVAAVHADPADVDPSDPEALDDLGWYGVQEIPDLLG